MKVGKASKYSLLFFLIFLAGLIFFVTYINQSLDKKSEIIPVEKPSITAQRIASSFGE